MLQSCPVIISDRFLKAVKVTKTSDIQEIMTEFACYITNIVGFAVTANIYEGVGLNGRKSVYCDFEGTDNTFRLYLEMTTNINHDPDLYVIDINLPGEMRGRGTGSKIICQLLDIATTLKINKITLIPVNRRAENFWAKFGFEYIHGKKLMKLDLSNAQPLVKCTLLLGKEIRPKSA